VLLLPAFDPRPLPDQRISTEKASEKRTMKSTEQVHFPPFRHDILGVCFLAD
jgi:hypothetical protein